MGGTGQESSFCLTPPPGVMDLKSFHHLSLTGALRPTRGRQPGPPRIPPEARRRCVANGSPSRGSAPRQAATPSPLGPPSWACPPSCGQSSPSPPPPSGPEVTDAWRRGPGQSSSPGSQPAPQSEAASGPSGHSREEVGGGYRCEERGGGDGGRRALRSGTPDTCGLVLGHIGGSRSTESTESCPHPPVRAGRTEGTTEAPPGSPPPPLRPPPFPTGNAGFCLPDSAHPQPGSGPCCRPSRLGPGS